MCTKEKETRNFLFFLLELGNVDEIATAHCVVFLDGLLALALWELHGVLADGRDDASVGKAAHGTAEQTARAALCLVDCLCLGALREGAADAAGVADFATRSLATLHAALAIRVNVAVLGTGHGA